MDKQFTNENFHPNTSDTKPVDSTDLKPASISQQTATTLDSEADPKPLSFTKDDLSKLADLLTAKLIGSGLLKDFSPTAK